MSHSDDLKKFHDLGEQDGSTSESIPLLGETNHRKTFLDSLFPNESEKECWESYEKGFINGKNQQKR